MKLLRFPPGFTSRPSEAGKSKDLVSRLLLENLSSLYSLAYRLCGERGLAEDFVQDTVRKALEGAPALRHRQHLRAWLFKILTNVARDHLRRSDNWDESNLAEHFARTPAISVLSEATTHDVRNALSQLSSMQRAIILLVDMEDFTLAEAAEMLQIPLGTAASRMARARKELQQRLAAYRSERGRGKGSL
ncbi:MAG: RNA polymerase sigma factor [Acidobacteria bacterium]|nr:RNA polymerase sigma factor [Acidobacteriota bacterium]MCI0623414.1 RNA polymerase sigma factor [Acidobacteriota bacterium]MCI0722200.1 RNA polymerase sigma factor [Acidobacteriota bacterium]